MERKVGRYARATCRRSIGGGGRGDTRYFGQSRARGACATADGGALRPACPKVCRRAARRGAVDALHRAGATATRSAPFGIRGRLRCAPVICRDLNLRSVYKFLYILALPRVVLLLLLCVFCVVLCASPAASSGRPALRARLVTAPCRTDMVPSR